MGKGLGESISLSLSLSNSNSHTRLGSWSVPNMDPVMSCSGCEIISDFLEGSYYYALDLQRQNQDYGHVVPPETSDICTTSAYLSNFQLREDIYGFRTFVHQAGSGQRLARRGAVEGPLNQFCKELVGQNPTQARKIVSTGEVGSFCADYCDKAKGLTFLDKVQFAAVKDSSQWLRSLPYLLLAMLFVFCTLQYAYAKVTAVFKALRAKKDK